MRALLATLALFLAGCHHEAQHGHAGLLATIERSGHVEGPPAVEVDPRIPHLTRYPCSKCHEKPLSVLKQTKPAAHWEVKLQHAPNTFTACTTCHSEAPTQSLKLMNGKEISFDESHLLCAQCHSRQAADWRGGAHGKRTSGWADQRRVLNCTGCHNSHQPRLAPRWPAISRTHSEETP